MLRAVFLLCNLVRSGGIVDKREVGGYNEVNKGNCSLVRGVWS